MELNSGTDTDPAQLRQFYENIGFEYDADARPVSTPSILHKYPG